MKIQRRGNSNSSVDGRSWQSLLEGDLVEDSYRTTFEETGITYEWRSRFNWKTGWAVYFYEKEANSTFTISEYEFSTSNHLVPGFDNIIF